VAAVPIASQTKKKKTKQTNYTIKFSIYFFPIFFSFGASSYFIHPDYHLIRMTSLPA
jgi:hypothetical protein